MLFLFILFFHFLTSNSRYLLIGFDECWVPDKEDHLLSGELSISNKIYKTRFIGPISSLSSMVSEKELDILIILSGPEPARTKIEKKLIEKYARTQKKIALVRGTNRMSQQKYPPGWQIHDRVNRETISLLLSKSSEVISRAGYSSIMDYYKIKVGATLIPTPGQSEQEYLAAYLDGKMGFKRL